MNFSKAMKLSRVLGVMLFATPVPIGQAASAPTAELAKKCREMMIKAYPPLPSGSRNGNAQQQREYFRTCVAQSGKMESVVTPTEGRGN